VATSGIYVAGTSGSSTFYANPTAPTPQTPAAGQTAIVTIRSQVISAAPGASTVQVGTQAVTAGGSEKTLSGNSVATLNPSGSLIIKGASGVVSAYATPTVVASQIAIATIGGQVVSAAPEASTVQIGTQVVTAGGAVVTLANNDVATLNPSGNLIIEGPSGVASTYGISPAIATSQTIITTIAGQVISAAPGASTVKVGTQITTAGGSVITSAGRNNVATLNPSGNLIVEGPSGIVSTYKIPASTSNAVVHSIGAIIASCIYLSSHIPISSSVFLTVASQLLE
jgi:hypothetical protein